MQVFAAAMAATILAAGGVRLIMGPFLWRHMPFELWATKYLLQALVVAVPPAVLFGAADGFDLYRLAAGSREWRPIGCVQWVVAGLVTLCMPPIALAVLCFFLQYQHRERVLVQGARNAWEGVIFYALGLLVISLLDRDSCRDLWMLAAVAAVVSLFISDAIVINALATWRRQGRLAPPTSHVFQYSLGALLLFVLGLGSWMTALVLMFGG